jgi:predicted dehydrogenase
VNRTELSRRAFLAATTAAAAPLLCVLPALALPTSEARYLRIGLIGASAWATTFAAANASHPHAAITASTCEKAYRSLLDDPKIDAIVIGPGVEAAAKLMLETCTARKDLYCLMPGSLSCEEASQILEAARRGGCIVHVAWTTDPSRHSRLHEAAARVIAGDIGTLQAVYCGCDAGLAELEVAARAINLAAVGTMSVVPAGRAAVLSGREAHGASIAFSDAAAVIAGGPPGMTWIGSRGTLFADSQNLYAEPAALLTQRSTRELMPADGFEAWLQAVRDRTMDDPSASSWAAALAMSHLLTRDGGARQNQVAAAERLLGRAQELTPTAAQTQVLI